MDSIKCLWGCRASADLEAMPATAAALDDRTMNQTPNHHKTSKSTRRPKTVTAEEEHDSFQLQQQVKILVQDSTMSITADEDLEAISAWRNITTTAPPPASPNSPNSRGSGMKRTSSTRASPHFSSYRNQIEQSFRQPHPHVVDSWNQSVSQAVESFHEQNAMATSDRKSTAALEPEQPSSSISRRHWKTKSEEYLKALNCVAPSSYPKIFSMAGDEWGIKPAETSGLTSTTTIRSKHLMDETDDSFLSSVDSSMMLNASREDVILHFPTTTAARPFLLRSSSSRLSETSSISRPDTDDGDSQPDRPREHHHHRHHSSTRSNKHQRSSSTSRTRSSSQSHLTPPGIIQQHEYQAPGAHRREIDPTVRSKTQPEHSHHERSSSLSRLRPSHRDSPSVHSRRSLSRGRNSNGSRTTSGTICIDDKVTQQYETACRLLKSAILEKNLDEAERNFLANILLETKPPEQQHDDSVTTTTTTPTSSKKELQASNNDVSQLTSPTMLSGFPFCKASSFVSNSQSTTNCNFQILGCELITPVFTPMIMEALQGFMMSHIPLDNTAATMTTTMQPFHNFWLKYSTVRDPVSMAELLESIRSSRQTVFCIETTDGDVFGAAVSTKWRMRSRWYGSNESFLWRLKKPRTAAHDDDDDDYNELEIYPNTNVDTMVQYCTEKALAFGGNVDWSRLRDGCPYGPDEPQGIGLLIDGDLMGGESNSCVTFANPSLCRRSNHTAHNEFDVKTLEVWTTTPCSTVPDAERYEMGGVSVVHETTAVVERSNNIFACVRR